jgi:hypothetical protein
MRRFRAGDEVEDLCRACKIDRLHSVIVADAGGRPVRVQCDYCGSQHNYRGGGESRAAAASPAFARGAEGSGRPADARGEEVEPLRRGGPADRAPFELVNQRECLAGSVSMSTPDTIDLERLLRRIIREEAGVTAAVPADKWRGGTLVLRPGNPALQEKAWPIETLFHKIVMIRNRLRTLEQQVNAAELPADVKVKLQSYITGCYGSLTSFNVLFADEEDQFKGTGEA